MGLMDFGLITSANKPVNEEVAVAHAPQWFLTGPGVTLSHAG